MNRNDAQRIVELSASIWSAVKNTETTVDAWFLALSRTNFYDAMDAVGWLARERKSVHVSDIVKRAELIRSELIRSLPPIPDEPSELADDPRSLIAWQRTALERQLSAVRLQRHAVPA